MESTEGGIEGGDNPSDEAIEVGVGRALNVEGATANVVDGLVVKHDVLLDFFEGGLSSVSCTSLLVVELRGSLNFFLAEPLWPLLFDPPELSGSSESSGSPDGDDSR